MTETLIDIVKSNPNDMILGSVVRKKIYEGDFLTDRLPNSTEVTLRNMELILLRQIAIDNPNDMRLGSSIRRMINSLNDDEQE